MFKASIDITECELNKTALDLEKLFNADNFEAKTSKVYFQRQNNGNIKITIESGDVVSFRASLNGITTMLSIYYQSKKTIIEEQNE